MSTKPRTNGSHDPSRAFRQHPKPAIPPAPAREVEDEAWLRFEAETPRRRPDVPRHGVIAVAWVWLLVGFLFPVVIGIVGTRFQYTRPYAKPAEIVQAEEHMQQCNAVGILHVAAGIAIIVGVCRKVRPQTGADVALIVLVITITFVQFGASLLTRLFVGFFASCTGPMFG
jgi:hypothetical protein